MMGWEGLVETQALGIGLAWTDPQEYILPDSNCLDGNPMQRETQGLDGEIKTSISNPRKQFGTHSFSDVLSWSTNLAPAQV